MKQIGRKEAKKKNRNVFHFFEIVCPESYAILESAFETT